MFISLSSVWVSPTCYHSCLFVLIFIHNKCRNREPVYSYNYRSLVKGTCRRLCAATSPQGLVLPSWPDHMKMMMITRSWSWS
ncbi:hypothetical protein SETIT_3G305000v2 [Setaria italica]|uniref:Uncharacterized protein n=1 Tax=Setaria italica TaxID=4555 RepID=A0A368QKM6_SETIT|nr:hypothetical protein SETIT_3G305000v2 [Setaria italica]